MIYSPVEETSTGLDIIEPGINVSCTVIEYQVTLLSKEIANLVSPVAVA